MKQEQTDILIIGLGLAGMTAAITAAKSGKKITMIDGLLSYYYFTKSDSIFSPFKSIFTIQNPKNMKN